MGKNFRVGCDVGGTFTDVTLLNEETGKLTLIKMPSTPREPEIGALKSIEKAICEGGLDPKKLSYVFHATTIATNAIIGQTGLELSKVGLITTKGFRDLLEIGRQIRPDPYDFFTDKPKPLIPRYLRKEVSERIGADGRVIIPLNLEEVKTALRELKSEDVKSIAVCTIFSFLNPSHEREIGELIRRDYPEIRLSLSHQILPEFREYERMSTTVINAYLVDIIDRYLASMEEGIRRMGIDAEFLLMQSNGRAMTAKMAMERPVYIVESGPAAGVVAASYIGRLMGYMNLVSFDMGGTTAKTSLIEGGQPKVTTDFEVGGKIASGRIVRGSGWPVKIPVIDIVEVGAGGGSMAWIDSGGALKVGPKSAGADPGPACYGKGGEEPTITDAYVLLGVINPEYFVGGKMPIFPELAEMSIKKRLSEPLGMDDIEVANGIAEVANANMIRALRIVSVERGRDPREMVMIAFGGAGPMVAGSIMDDLGFSRVVIPEAPGLFSAFGMLVSDIGHDYTLTRIRETSSIDYEALSQDFASMVKAGIKDLASEGISEDRIVITKSIDMRYVGQSYELNVPFPEGEVTKALIENAEDRFHSLHEARYGHCAPEERVEMVNLRVSAIGIIPKLKLKKSEIIGEDPSKARKHRREAFFSKIDDFIETEIYDRYRLEPGNVIFGPAIIEQVDSTTVINPGHSAYIDEYGQILIKSV